ncbi:MAG: amidohydrolase family protein, partial [Micropepsaceae bacterium]
MAKHQIEIFFLTVVLVVALYASVASQTRPLAITRVGVIDVASGQIARNSTVVVNGDRIVSITPNGRTPANAEILDGLGKFIIPGLWDMHAHVEATRESSLQLYVVNGVTGIRDMGSELEFILRMRDATTSGRILGPRVFLAGPILDDAPGDWPFRMRVKTAADGKAAVQTLKQRGVDLIKVHDNTPRDVFFAIADEARQQNMRLAGHIPRGLTAEQVIEAGQRDIEHLSNGRVWRACSGGGEYRPDACRPFFEMLARQGIWQTPTIAAGSELATIGTSASEISPDQMAYAAKSLRAVWA